MRIIVVFCIISLSSYAFAEDAKPPLSEQSAEQSVDDTKKQNTNPSPATNTIDKSKGKQNDDIFHPSEEISEDFAVSFPVDI